jgi:DNA-binding NarL/FixJ family response regulator
VVKIVVIKQQAMMSEALRVALSQHDDMEVVGAVTSVDEGAQLAVRRRADVVVVDYQRPVDGGPDPVAAVRAASDSVAILAMSADADYDTVVTALAAGAHGFVVKDQTVTELVDAVRLAHAGGRPLAPQLVSTLVSRLTGATPLVQQLTPREIEVLRYLADGMSTTEIGAVMRLSVNTVRNHVQKVLRRLGAHSKLEAVAIARREGILGRLNAAS